MFDRIRSVRRLQSVALGAALLPLLALTTFQRSSAQSDEPLVEDLTRMVRYLSSDELEGRRTGTRGNLLAAGYIAGEFAAIGLEPVGGAYLHDFSYLKSVHLGDRNRLTIGSTNPAAILDGEGGAEVLEPGTAFTPLGFSSSGSYGGDLVFVGYGISAPDEGYDDYAGVNVAGKVVLMLRYSPDGEDAHGALSSYGQFVTKALTAKEKGAAAMIIVDLSPDGGLIPLFMVRGFRDAGIGAISLHPDYLSLFHDVNGKEIDFRKIAARIDSTRQPESFRIGGGGISITTDLVQESVEAPNVLGMIPGTDPKLKDEIIVVGAHFDHLGHGGEGSLSGSDQPAIHNGADDNASGTASVIALAKEWVKKGGNRRTLIFMAFNGEEEGLLGSAHLVEDPPFNLLQVVTMVNLDMVGRMKENEVVVQGTGTASPWKDLLAASNPGEGLTLKQVPDGFGPSDHSSFYGKEIPVLFFFTGLHSDYHRPSDDWDLVNYDGMAKIVGLVDRVITNVDRLEERPGYINVPRKSDASNVRLKVVLGVIPDYGYGGDGLRITGVNEGGAADRGGLKSGDIIIGIAGKEINGIYAYMDALKPVEPGDEIEVIVDRAGKKLRLVVVATGK